MQTAAANEQHYEVLRSGSALFSSLSAPPWLQDKHACQRGRLEDLR